MKAQAQKWPEGKRFTIEHEDGRLNVQRGACCLKMLAPESFPKFSFDKLLASREGFPFERNVDARNVADRPPAQRKHELSIITEVPRPVDESFEPVWFDSAANHWMRGR